MAKHNLTINLIPYRLTSDGVDLWFTSMPGAGQKIPKKWVPADLNVPVDREGNTFWALEESPNATMLRFEFFKKGVDEKNRRHFTKRVFTQILFKHFSSNQFIVGTSYIGDARVWALAENQPSDRRYRVYDKFSLRVDIDTFGRGSGVFLSYDGQSSVTTLVARNLSIADKRIIGKVVLNNQVYSRKHDDFPANLDDCRIVFNREVEKTLGIALERQRPTNKYREFYEKILCFNNKYLSGQHINNCFEVLTGGFLDVPEASVSYVGENSNLLEFKNEVRNVNVYDGLKKSGGPYFSPDLSNLRFLFIFMNRDREAANKLFSFLNKGYRNFPGLEKYVSVPFTVDFQNSLRLEREENILAEVSTWLRNVTLDPQKKYFAIYVSPIDKNDEDTERHAVYFKVKEMLLEKEISSQVVFNNHLSKDAFNLYLPNIAVAVLAKLGGIPWRLPYPLKKDLVVGIGVHRDMESTTSFIGNAICFRNDGQFEEFKVFPADEISQLGESLKGCIREFITGSGACDRLIVHYYKDVGAKEQAAIDTAMRQLDVSIPYIFVTVKDTESRDYVIFDKGFEGIIPTSGTIVRLRYNEFLLCNNTRYQSSTGQKLSGYPFPVKIKVKSEPKEITADFSTVKDIVDQVYEFSRIYWKSVRQRNKPVTIEYSEIIARVVSHFGNKKLPESKVATKSLWFL